MLAYLVAGVIGGMTSAVITFALGHGRVAVLFCYVVFGIAGLIAAMPMRLTVSSQTKSRVRWWECGAVKDLRRAG